MGSDELIGRLVDALAEAKAASSKAELALKVAHEALAIANGLKNSTHQVQYVNSDALGQINKEMSQYMPDATEGGVEADFELGKRLAAMGEALEGVDDEID